MASDDRADGRKGAELNDTIFALSSGAPPAAIALIRISGPRAGAALEHLAGRSPPPRTATVATLRWNGEPLDQALLLSFPGPNSVTGEDVAELHLHGGRSVVAAVQRVLAQMEGLRSAEPGEFTRRAFENGRIDLAEAEGLADLLEAETESQRRNALMLADGALSRAVADWQRQLLDLAATVEAALDFSDEADVVPVPAGFAAGLQALDREIGEWLARPSAERLKDGVRIVIAGPPNSGKSSLFNALVGRDAAITSEIPGTTRDLIEAPIALGGIPFLFIDTAGLRETADDVEEIGIERARSSAAAADLILWLGPSDEAPAGALRLHAKSDLGPSVQAVDLEVSALTGAGMPDLIRILIQRSNRLLPGEGELALNSRQRRWLEAAFQMLNGAEGEADLLIIGEQLRLARRQLDRITGRAGTEDMLDALFGRFCIGK